MSLFEFALIERFFSACGAPRPDCALGVGDDAALLRIPPGQQLAVTQDTLVEGVHFFTGTDPAGLGHKALAVNLSDLAAMGAEPAWVTLALTLPTADPAWLGAFAAGFCALAQATGVQLVGGDTTRGPLALSVTALGLLPGEQALRRSGARPGDLIYVSGTLGDAGLALELLGKDPLAPLPRALRERLERPSARLALGRALRPLASAAIDVSDGLAADLGHILEGSGMGAVVRLADLPLSAFLDAHLAQGGDPLLPLTAGDDYELCFTLPPGRRPDLEALSPQLDCPVTCIGQIETAPGLRVLGRDGRSLALALAQGGYEHFGAHG
jgi:thiamine-monophosphate kinase